MKTLRRIASASALALPLLLSGCFMLSTTRKLPVPVAPSNVQTLSAEDLVTQLNQRWDTLQTLSATVEMQLSVFKTTAGEATDYTTIPTVILLRKSQMLRVYGMVPVIRTRAIDMVSDGKKFTIWIPSKNKAIKGSNKPNKKSANALENLLRPDFFYDTIVKVVRGLEPGGRLFGSRGHGRRFRMQRTSVF